MGGVRKIEHDVREASTLTNLCGNDMFLTSLKLGLELVAMIEFLEQRNFVLFSLVRDKQKRGAGTWQKWKVRLMFVLACQVHDHEPPKHVLGAGIKIHRVLQEAFTGNIIPLDLA